MTVYVHKDEFEEKEQQVIAGIHRLVQPDFVEMESDLALIAVVGRGMKSQRGTAGRIFSALAHANVNVKMIDQGSSELNIIIGVENRDFSILIEQKPFFPAIPVIVNFGFLQVLSTIRVPLSSGLSMQIFMRTGRTFPVFL